MPQPLPCVLVGLTGTGPVLPPPRAPYLRADDLGLLRGDGVFERFLVTDGRPRHLDEHLDRLSRSARAVGLTVPTPQQWRQAVDMAVGAWEGPAEWEMRLVCTRGPEEGGPPSAFALGQVLGPELVRRRRDGLAVVSLLGPVGAALSPEEVPWLLLGAKTLSYAVNVAAKRYATSLGADDALFVDGHGSVLEGPTSAVVALFGRRLVSPPPSIGILDSISTSRFLALAEDEGWEVARERLQLDDLFTADAVWSCSSLLFAHVRALDGKSLPPAGATHDELASIAGRS